MTVRGDIHSYKSGTSRGTSSVELAVNELTSMRNSKNFLITVVLRGLFPSSSQNLKQIFENNA